MVYEDFKQEVDNLVGKHKVQIDSDLEIFMNKFWLCQVACEIAKQKEQKRHFARRVKHGQN